MDEIWVLVHREGGPVQTFMSREEAERVRAAVIADEPSWAEDVTIEPFELRVDARADALE